MQAMNALKFSALRSINVSKARWVTTTTRYTRQYKTPTVAVTTAAKAKKEVTPVTPAESPVVEETQKKQKKDSFASSENALINELDKPIDAGHDWSTSFHGLSTERFPREVSDVLLEPVDANDVEIKPDGIIYLPEIKYRRILNRAFGPGGWGLVPRTDHTISPKNISREYALVCSGRFVSQARGEQDYFDVSGLPTATEGCKSNALMRCCKDLGVASELWDPIFIKKFKKKYCTEVWAEHVTTKKKKKLWRKKDDLLEYPYKEN